MNNKMQEDKTTPNANWQEREQPASPSQDSAPFGTDSAHNSQANRSESAAAAKEPENQATTSKPEQENNSENEQAKLIEDNQKLKDQMLRLAAEMENLRRRSERDMQEARLYAISQFARDMLSVADNLERAIKALPSQAREQDKNIDNFAQGVEMTQKSMLSSLERHGVSKIEALGKKFDPNFHQAMFESNNNEIANNHVIEVIQEGFVIGERVLRPALVGINKSTAAAEPAANSNDKESPAH